MQRLRFSVVSVVAVCCALVAGGGAASAGAAAITAPAVPGATGTWGTAQPVLGLPAGSQWGAIDTVSCASPGNCSAGGRYATGSDFNSLAFVVDETDGVWGKAQPVAGAQNPAFSAYVVALVSSISCASPGNCSAGGLYGADHGGTNGYPNNAFVVDETGGVWGKAQEVAGAPALNYESQVNQVSCTSPGNCSAGGSYTKTTGAGGAFVVDETNGVWGSVKNVSSRAVGPAGEWSIIDSVSCPTAADCAAVGFNNSGTSGYGYNSGLLVDKSVHKPTATAVAVSAVRVAYGDERAERIRVKVTAGSAGLPTGTVTVTSGATTICTTPLASGGASCALSARTLPAGPVTITASYNGSYVFGVSASTAGFTVVKDATKTGLTLSARKVSYGHEQAEKLSVAVSPQFAGTPGGRVTVKAGRTTLCVITLKSGKGTCALTAKKLQAGIYRLSAVYSGSTDYASSAATGRTLTVAK
jgi:hypothetical protein